MYFVCTVELLVGPQNPRPTYTAKFRDTTLEVKVGKSGELPWTGPPRPP